MAGLTIFPLVWMVLGFVHAARAGQSLPPPLSASTDASSIIGSSSRDSASGRYFVNSLLVAFVVTVAVAVVNSMAGYALAKLRFAGATASFAL